MIAAELSANHSYSLELDYPDKTYHAWLGCQVHDLAVVIDSVFPVLAVIKQRASSARRPRESLACFFHEGFVAAVAVLMSETSAELASPDDDFNYAGR